MQELLKDAFQNSDYEKETLLLSEVAKICRSELLEESHFMCAGHFPQGCQEEILPAAKLLVSMILHGSKRKW